MGYKLSHVCSSLPSLSKYSRRFQALSSSSVSSSSGTYGYSSRGEEARVKRRQVRVKAGLEDVDKGLLEGLELKILEKEDLKASETTLSEWFLELQMNDSFDIDDGFSEEAKQFTKAFKARLSSGDETFMCLLKGDHVVSMISVKGWRLNAIVVSPFEPDAKESSQKLLDALKSLADASNRKLDMPVAAQLMPFGLE
eukprot:CAMPEP_0184490306 /NCGR_PEP_ID=MMETSP0113_2-20130426/17522_1 /TAXON_ID=91329 /ORGANISM="Norrisiella sphaerica, Strain BC52" /LENGTH=196 /DNA_ID=CAMNT_0026874115 /DNA_START=229 /DNA_END=819 /DNA_ORIENTATION=+